ncbi:MAG: SMODS domain-containing nucleotidyltransferase [Candidatus Nanoarchaeia archaeon]
MKKSKINEVLESELLNIKPSGEDLDAINRVLKEFLIEVKQKIKTKKINASVFVGGSLAKKTIIKKQEYDVDIFVRFNKKYEDIALELENILKSTKYSKKIKKIHGSRDYFQINEKNIILEVIPTLEIKKPSEAKNITDLSYFHVGFVKKCIEKNKNLALEIMLAKAFMHAQNLYGAESYIHGFSGYSLELLIIHYRTFERFLREAAKLKDEKIIIDYLGIYKNKKDILREMNESKIQGPIILVDPTYKERNALAGLNNETFLKFKKEAQEFLNNPSRDFFKKKTVYDSIKNKKGLIKISVKSSKQKGDIAGSKIKKFFGFFVYSLKREFDIKLAEFEYNEKENIGYYYFILENKKPEIIIGPEVTDIENLLRFKKMHKDAFIKENRAYAKLNHNMNFKEFFEKIKNNKKILLQMSIQEINLD